MDSIAPVLQAAKERFVLGRRSVHGFAHWERVRSNGLRLAKQTGADPLIVELFAYLHDSCRESDGLDFEHGPRAAEFANWLRESAILQLEDHAFALLHEAIRDHTSGSLHSDPTIGTCWDADRLDLGRVGKRPHPRFLSTRHARTPPMIEWAWKRSRKGA